MISVSPSTGRHNAAPPYLNPAQLSLPGIVCVVAAHIAVFAVLRSLDVIPLPPKLKTLMVRMIPPLPTTTHARTSSQPPLQQAREKPARTVAPRQADTKPEPETTSLTPTQRLTAQTGTADAASDVRSERHVDPITGRTTHAAPSSLTLDSEARFDADYLRNPAPAYPALARRLGEEGKLVLRVFVTPEGHPGQIELKTSSGSPRLDQAAQDRRPLEIHPGPKR
jgi:periplasmic protein TonB